MERERMDQLIEKLGGKDRLVLVVQKRLGELAKGAEPQVQIASKDLVEVALEEIYQGKVEVTIPAEPPAPVAPPAPPTPPAQPQLQPFGRPPVAAPQSSFYNRRGNTAGPQRRGNFGPRRGPGGGGFRGGGGGGWRGPR